MGKKRIAILGEEPSFAKASEGKEKHKKSLKEERGVRVPGLKGGERVVAVTAEPIPEEVSLPPTPTTKPTTHLPSPPKLRGKKYKAAKTKIDPTKFYPIPEAIKLLKVTSYGRFDGSAEIHLVTGKTGIQGDVSLPYFAGKPQKILIVTHEKVPNGKLDHRKHREEQRAQKNSVPSEKFSAFSDRKDYSESPTTTVNISELENLINKGLNYSVVLATPQVMPSLVKYAKILGPKGLMPNPKNGTIIEKPEEALKKFQKASVSFKTEPNAPLVHAVFGKVSQKEGELEENLKIFLAAVGIKNIKRAVIKATMGPGIKVELTKT